MHLHRFRSGHLCHQRGMNDVRRWWWPVVTAAIYCLVAAEAGRWNGDTNRSLAFVFDTTGSMHDDYVQLKSHANDIMTYVLNRNDTDVGHFVFVPFNDPDVGPVLETFKPEEIMHELNKIQVHGGGDCPEMGITAVIEALRAAKPNSHIYVFTDASPKDTNLVNEALELIQRKQSQVVVLRTAENCGSSDRSYEQIASLGSGNVFNVDKGDVSKVLEFVKTSMETNQVNLLSLDISQSQKNPSPKNLSIDESIKNLMVSVTGFKPTIELVDPIGKKMNEAQGLITELNLKNIKIVNVIEPIPGEWTLYVTSESAHTIRASGVSSMHFNFGFAIKEPKDMTQTSHRPLKGAENYVLVNCQEVKKFLSCKIQDLNSGNNTKLLPIIDLGQSMLLCGPFVPDDNPFHVQIFGINNNGHYFKRITKTSIIPEEPDTPYITTPNQVIAVVGGELRINCHVESLVPFTVTWKGLNYPQSTWNFSQSSEIELLVPNVTTKQNGIYTCGAKNRAGEAESTTNVTLLSKPVIVEGNNNVTVTLYEGEDYSMTCTGQGEPTPKMHWLINNSPFSHSNDHIFIIKDFMRLIIYDAVLRDSKVYTCKASNDVGTAMKHYNVIVKVKTSNTSANVSLVMNEFDDALLRCPITNMDNQWFKDGVNTNNLVYQRADEKHFRKLNRELKIYELDPTDSGIYTCRSSNASYSFDLQVAVVPYFIEQPLEKLTVQRNETVVLDCSAKGYPKPKVLWRKTDLLMPVTYWTLKKIGFSNNKQTLKIYSVDWIHNGTYSCTVKNKLGDDKRNFEIHVI